MQKALDSLLKIYLQKETRAELGGSNKNNAEAYTFGIEEEPIQPQEEEEFLQALYKCLEEKGVMREMQAFLRQKLVNILKGVWPNLVSTRCEGNLGRVTTMLIEDFMCSHKLLFTYSVLATELDEGVTLNKGNFGKMPFAKAETLLMDIGIKKDSKLSRTILRSYSQNGDWSLIECIIDSTAWLNPKNEPPMTVNELSMTKENERKDAIPIDEKMRQINEKYFEKTKNISSASIEEKLKNLTEAMELQKEAEIEMRIEKFREVEVAKIRDEIETKLKFEILQKEKELLRNFENQVTHLKRSLKREKQVWMIERNQKEKELSETRKELVKALMTLKTDENLKNDDQKNPTEDSAVDAPSLVEPKPIEQKTKPKKRRDPNESEIEDNGPKPPEKYSSTILNAVNVKKELEREFLLKEASLRNAIDKLKTENEWLKLKKNESVQGRGQPVTADIMPEVFYERPREIIRQSPQPSENLFADTIALMKYKIESQSEEIEQLRQNLDGSNDRDRNLVPSRVQLNPQRTRSDIDTFLEESKRRFAEIDHEAKTVELTINAIHGRKQQKSSSRSNWVEDNTSRKFGPEIPRLPPPYRNSSLFLETDARKYEYFPKYLSPVVRKPPPINEYKPKLGSDSNPVKHFGLPHPEFFLGSTRTSSLVGTNQILTTNSNSTVSVPNRLDIQVLSDSKISDKESKTENYTTNSEISATELGRQVFDAQISDSTGQIRDLQKKSDTRDRISVENPPSFQQASPPKIMHVEKRAESKNPEINNNGLAKSKPITIENGHQQKASASGALVKDKLSTVSAVNELAKADLSESSISIHSNKSVIQKSEEIVQPTATWRDILTNSANNKNLLDSNQVEESIADIGHIETGDPEDEDDAEDFWAI